MQRQPGQQALCRAGSPISQLNAMLPCGGLVTSSPPSVRKLSIRANVGKCFRLSFQMLAFGDTILSRTGQVSEHAFKDQQM